MYSTAFDGMMKSSLVAGELKIHSLPHDYEYFQEKQTVAEGTSSFIQLGQRIMLVLAK